MVTRMLVALIRGTSVALAMVPWFLARVILKGFTR